MLMVTRRRTFLPTPTRSKTSLVSKINLSNTPLMEKEIRQSKKLRSYKKAMQEEIYPTY